MRKAVIQTLVCIAAFLLWLQMKPVRLNSFATVPKGRFADDVFVLRKVLLYEGKNQVHYRAH